MSLVRRWGESYLEFFFLMWNNIYHFLYTADPGVLHLLEFVAQEPHQSWRYKSQQLPKGPTAIQPSIIANPPSNAALASQITLDNNPVVRHISSLSLFSSMLYTIRYFMYFIIHRSDAVLWACLDPHIFSSFAKCQLYLKRRLIPPTDSDAIGPYQQSQPQCQTNVSIGDAAKR